MLSACVSVSIILKSIIFYMINGPYRFLSLKEYYENEKGDDD